jgi:hypothetical protein
VREHLPALDRPEAARPSFVTEVCGVTGGANENALPRLDDLVTAVTRAVLFFGARNKTLSTLASALPIADSSPIPISHLPFRCSDRSFPPLRMSGSESENHSPASIRQAEDFIALCGPSIISMSLLTLKFLS